MARYLADLEGQDEATYRIGTGAGLIVPVIHADGSVTVDMGPPELSARKVRRLHHLVLIAVIWDASLISTMRVPACLWRHQVPTTLAANKDGIALASELSVAGKTWAVTSWAKLVWSPLP